MTDFSPRRFAQAAVGGLLMGLANLVPGISGGTMLLATGIYTEFIDALASVTRLRLRVRSLLLLAVVGAAGGLAIVALAGPVRDLVVARRWIMYSLFVGLTLGGIPVLWRRLRPADRDAWIGTAAGFVAMAALAWAQAAGAMTGGDAGGSWSLLVVAGIAGASSMILPGVSGGYMLLVLGQYVPILSAIDTAGRAVGAGDVATLGSTAVAVFLPVGIGMVLGVALVSNLLRHLLHRHPKPTLGFLLGLLAGVVVGLWPFQATVPPVPGETVVGGVTVTEETLEEIAEEDWPVAYFRPSAGQVAGAAGLMLAGMAITGMVARLDPEARAGRRRETRSDD